MSVMARERRARDWWISPGHVRAAAVGVSALCALSFSLGVAYGRGHAGEAAASSLGEEAEDLEEVLARLHASNDPNDGVGSLTWPDTLRTAGDAVLPVAPEAVPQAPAALLPSVSPVAPVGDALPTGAYTLRVEPSDEPVGAARDSLRAAGHDAWVRQRIVDGVDTQELMIGSFDDEAAAAAARDAVAAQGLRATVSPVR
jgi:hypothetical protein